MVSVCLSGLVEKLLPVLDNFETLLSVNELNEETRMFYLVKMIEKQFRKSTKEGLSPSSSGCKF